MSWDRVVGRIAVSHRPHPDEAVASVSSAVALDPPATFRSGSLRPSGCC